jgi:hypothetical protein
MKTALSVKLTICSLIAFLFGIEIAKAQSEIQNPKSEIDSAEAYQEKQFKIGKVTFGFKAGYTHSNLYGNELDYIFASSKTNWLPSFHAGFIVNTQWGKYFWLKHELLVNQRGAKVSLSDSAHGDYHSNLKMLYLDLHPVSPAFHIKGFQIYAGPYVSALTHACIQRKDENGKLFNDKSIFGDAGNSEGEGENKYLQKFDFGLNAGIEYQFPFGLLIGIKYNHGFTDIFQYANSYTNGDTKVDNIKIYNKALMVSLGYSFVKNKKIR